MTSFHRTAPPKKLTVTQGSQSPTSLLIQWSASCDNINEAIGYIVSDFAAHFTTYINLKNILDYRQRKKYKSKVFDNARRY